MPTQKHFATLDGFRGLAALAVVTLHAAHSFNINLVPHGGLAVDFFFCLSGFVIGYAYEYRLRSFMSFRDFVVVRLIRLYPLIFVGLLFGTLVYVFSTWQVHHQNPFVGPLFISVGLEAFLIPCPPILGENWSSSSPLDPPAWSLLFEFLANFAYAAFARQLSGTRLKILILIGAISVFLQAYFLDGVTGGFYWDNLWGGFSRVLFPFFCGLFLYRKFESRFSGKGGKSAFWLPIVLLSAFFCPVPTNLNWLYESCVVVLLFPFVLMLGCLDNPGPRVKSLYLLLGRLSYPVYILSYPLIKPFGYFVRHYHQGWIYPMIGAEILAAFGISFLAMKFIDDPVRAWLTRVWARYKNQQHRQ